jgi:hypothetical protein
MVAVAVRFPRHNMRRAFVRALLLAVFVTAALPASLHAATATRAVVEADPHFATWAAALEPSSAPAIAADGTPATLGCATTATLEAEQRRRHELRMALLESLVARGIEPGPPPAGAGPWPWGLDAGTQPATSVIDSDGTSILVDAGRITYINRYGSPEVDPVLAARAFYAAHDDEYDFLVVFTNFYTQLTGLSFLAYHQAVANDVRGLGYAMTRTDELFDDTTFYTRKPVAGRLQSFLHLNNLANFPADPAASYGTRYTPVTLLGHELAHRWSGRAWLDYQGAPYPILLGRQYTHWSFFFNSVASPLEGNAWDGDDLHGYGTLDRALHYSPIDLYLMGMIPPAEVDESTLWYLNQVSDLQPPYDTFGQNWVAASAPTAGVACSATKVPFTIGELALTNGYRIPAYPDAPRDFRMAFALVVRDPATVTEADLDKLAALRRAFATWFTEETRGRGHIDATLHSVPARMVFVHHPHGNFENPAQPIPFETRITLEPWSLPTRLEDVQVSLHWSVDGGAFTETPMSATTAGEFATTIPPQANGATIRYWMRATSNYPGHESLVPPTAPTRPTRFASSPTRPARRSCTPPSIAGAASPSHRSCALSCATSMASMPSGSKPASATALGSRIRCRRRRPATSTKRGCHCPDAWVTRCNTASWRATSPRRRTSASCRRAAPTRSCSSALRRKMPKTSNRPGRTVP